MARLEMNSETPLSPAQVVEALTDFSERRLDIWPEIAPRYYEVYSVGEKTADVREGSVMGPMKVWARERYDWSVPGVVSWTVQESNFCTPGSYVKATISARPGGGSKIHVEWERTPTTIPARMIFVMMKLTNGKPIAASMAKGLKNYEGMTTTP